MKINEEEFRKIFSGYRQPYRMETICSYDFDNQIIWSTHDSINECEEHALNIINKSTLIKINNAKFIIFYNDNINPLKFIERGSYIKEKPGEIGWIKEI